MSMNNLFGISVLSLGVALFLASSAAFAAPPKPTPELIEKGRASYQTNCLSCHGEKGDGNGPAGAYLNPKPRNFNGTDKFKQGNTPDAIFKTLNEGVKTNPVMTSFKHLPEEERWGLVYYVRTFNPKTKAEDAKKMGK